VSVNLNIKSGNENLHLKLEQTKQNSMAFSLQVNCINSATTAGQRILVPTFVDREVSRGQRGGSTWVLISVF
jgi:hypothetical protein